MWVVRTRSAWFLCCGASAEVDNQAIWLQALGFIRGYTEKLRILKGERIHRRSFILKSQISNLKSADTNSELIKS